jgi:hypothetical protein
MTTKQSNSKSGLFSIVWMLGIFPVFYFLHWIGIVSDSHWIIGLTIVLVWVSVGLAFAVSGLMRGSLLGRICGLVVVAILVFIVWQMTHSVIHGGPKKPLPNKSPEPTAVGACRSAVAVHVASRRWLSFLR